MDFEQIAFDNISRPDADQLAPLTEAPEVGQVLAFFSRNSVRTGVVVKVGRKNAQVLYTTEGAVKTSQRIYDYNRTLTPDAVAEAAGRVAGENWDWEKGMADGTYFWKYEYDPAEYAAKIAKHPNRAEYVSEHAEAARERARHAIANSVKSGPFGYIHFTTKSVAIDKLRKVIA